MIKKSFLLFGIGMMVLWTINTAFAYPTNGLIAAYSFSGSADDESGNGKNGTVNGAVLTNDRYGNPESAYYFDGQGTSLEGSGDHIEFLDPLLNIGSDFTISFWVNMPNPTISNQYYLLSYGNSSSDTFHIVKHDNSNKFQIWSGSTGNPQLNFYSAMETGANTWYNIAAVYNGTDVLMYINGVENNSNPYDFSGIDISGSLYLGRKSYDPEYFLGGSMDDLYIYNRALSGSEILELYDAPNPIPEPATMLLLGSGLIGLAGFRRKDKKV